MPFHCRNLVTQHAKDDILKHAAACLPSPVTEEIQEQREQPQGQLHLVNVIAGPHSAKESCMRAACRLAVVADRLSISTQSVFREAFR